MLSPLPDMSVLEAGLILDDPLPPSSLVHSQVRYLLRTPRLSGEYSPSLSHRVSNAFSAKWPALATLQSPHFEEIKEPEVAAVAVEVRPLSCYAIREAASKVLDLSQKALDAIHDDVLSMGPRVSVWSKSTETTDSTHGRHRFRRHKASHKRSHDRVKNLQMRTLSCIASALLLAALLATYLSQLFNAHSLSTALNATFIIALLASTVLFGHSLIRLLTLAYPAPLRLQNIHHSALRRRRRRHRKHDSPPIPTPTSATSLIASAEETPSPAGPVRLVPSERGSSLFGEITTQASPNPNDDDNNISDQDDNQYDDDVAPTNAHRSRTTTLVYDVDAHDVEQGTITIRAPPPAYGRWRGSVRIEPDVLNWRPVVLNCGDRRAEGGVGVGVEEEGEGWGDTAAPPSYVTHVHDVGTGRDKEGGR